MDIGHVLSTMPPIIENIFKYFTIRELNYYSPVCELWNRVAESEKNRREDIFYFLQGLHCFVHDKIHSSCRECSRDTTRDIESEMSVELKNLKLKPYFCLSFATNYLINDFERLFPSFQFEHPSVPKRMKQEDILRKRAYLKQAIHTALRQYLPEQCKSTFCIAPGIIGSHAGSLPMEIEEGYGISGIMLPFVPGLEVYNFPIDEKNSDISKLIPSNTSIKCLLVFVTPYDSSCYNKIIHSCLLREKCRIAVGGAVVDRCESHSGTVVAFCGRGVEAASVIVNRTDREAELEMKLKQFQETELLQDKCFAFMFACVARGFFIYREYNLESYIFHKLYPEIPLLGVFGNGEIGVEFLPHMPTENHVLRIGKLARSRRKFLHSYTTVFVLVSLKM